MPVQMATVADKITTLNANILFILFFKITYEVGPILTAHFICKI